MVEPGRAAGRGGLHQRAPAEERRDDRAHRRPRAAPGQARGADHQRGPRRDRGRGRAGQRAQRGPGGRRRARRVRHASRAPTARCSSFDNVVVTPHLGASTSRGAGEGGHPGGQVGPARAGRRVRAGRGERPGRRGRRGAAAVAAARPRSSAGSSPRWPAARPRPIAVEVRGEIAGLDVSVLQLAALKGVFGDVIEEPVTYVNAPLVAKERGVEVSLSTDEVSQDWRNLLTLRGTAPGRPARLGQRHADRAAADREARRGQRASTWRSRPPSTWCSSATPTGPASSAPSARSSAARQINIAGMQVCRDATGRRRADRADRRLRRPGRSLVEIASAIGAGSAGRSTWTESV